MPEILTNINCEPGSEECPLSCNNRVATTTGFDEPYRSYDACHFGGEEIVNNKRTPSCLSAESKARELRERAERPRYNCLGPDCGYMKGKAFVEGFIEEVYQHLGLGQLASRAECMAAIERLKADSSGLHDRVTAVEEQRDGWKKYAVKDKARLRTTAQILIDEIGAEGPINAECAAREAVQLIKNLRAETSILQSRLKKAEGLIGDMYSLLSELGGVPDNRYHIVTQAAVFIGITPPPAKPATVEEPVCPHVEIKGWRIACDKCGDIPGIMMQSAESTREVLAGCGWTHNPDTKQDFCPKCTPAPELTEEEREELVNMSKYGPADPVVMACRSALRSCFDKGLVGLNSRNWLDLTPAGREVVRRDI